MANGGLVAGSAAQHLRRGSAITSFARQLLLDATLAVQLRVERSHSSGEQRKMGRGDGDPGYMREPQLMATHVIRRYGLAPPPRHGELSTAAQARVMTPVCTSKACCYSAMVRVERSACSSMNQRARSFHETEQIQAGTPCAVGESRTPHAHCSRFSTPMKYEFLGFTRGAEIRKFKCDG